MDYASPDYKDFLNPCSPDIFHYLWNVETDWLEPCNQRRGGWSGAKRVNLSNKAGVEAKFILKIQENCGYRSLRHGLLRRPTLDREASNLRFLTGAGIPVPELVYYGRRREHGTDRAILLIPELTGYRPLLEIMAESQEAFRGRAIASAVGDAVRRLHRLGWQHRNLYPKHIFVRCEPLPIDVYFIDLENARPCRKSRIHLEIGSLFRRTEEVGLMEKVAFIKSYCQCERIGITERKLMKSIVRSK